MKPRTLILRTAGTNCDGETAHAFSVAGAEPVFVHVNRLIEEPALVRDFQIVAFPGGFSYGDDIAAGKILATQINRYLGDALRDFVAAGKPIIGICNGFQVLVKTDLLPGPIGGRTGQTATLTHNESHRFIGRWTKLEPRPGNCIWTRDLGPIELPIAHGEGRFVPADENVRRALWDQRRVPLVYTAADNPNGSTDAIAGVCDATGLVFGLMPHPERFIEPFQHPAWTSRPSMKVGQGLQFFKNAVEHVMRA
jgi:phosphoribosylformylglycinamidine synthase I